MDRARSIADNQSPCYCPTAGVCYDAFEREMPRKVVGLGHGQSGFDLFQFDLSGRPLITEKGEKPETGSLA